MRLSLGYKAFVALLLGIFTGLVFGPLCNLLKPVADVYVMLLQMVALPFICFSLMHGLGSMSPGIGRKLFQKGWLFWVVLWGMIFGVIYLLNVLLPSNFIVFSVNANMKTGEAIEKSFLNYLVPENPIYDLANNIVPAIAVFGLIIGLALMHLEKKEPLLLILERGNQIMEKILYWLAIASPIGIFAHIAVASGTVYFEDLYLLQFYVWSFIFITAFFTLWVLPALISSLTPLSYKESLQAFQFVCLLPFATALPSVALPFISIYMKKLGKIHSEGEIDFQSTSQTVMPLCYSFGQIGNSLILFFILFMSYFFRHPLIVSQKLLMSLLTIPLSFGSSATSINAVSFLTEQFHFPPLTKELFSETMAITLNFQVLLSVSSVLTLIILILYSYYGLLQTQWTKLCTHIGIAFTLLTISIVAIRQIVPLQNNKAGRHYGQLSISEALLFPVSAKILSPGEFGTPRSFEENLTSEPLSSILRTGVLKVGYDSTQIPFSYFNRDDELVGFDIAYAYELARDLDCSLEFVPIAIDRMSDDLEIGKYDIGMSALIMNEERLKQMDFTSPYTEENNVLIINSRNKRQFTDSQITFDTPGLKLGAIGGYKSVVERHFPLAILISGLQMDQALLQGKVDGWVWGITSSLVWCQTNPHFVVADYQGLIGQRYFAYPIRKGALDFNLFLNNWLILKAQSGFKERMKRYWIEGESIQHRPPRWSILRNLLQWNSDLD